MTKQICAKLCNDCAKTCMKCVSDYKKATGKKKEMLKKCAELCHCCAIICKACAELCKCCKDSCCLKEQCKVCAKVCECCMKECKKHMKHHAQCKKCYDICKKCSTKCKAMCKPSKKLKGGMSNGPSYGKSNGPSYGTFMTFEQLVKYNLFRKLSSEQILAIRNYKKSNNQPISINKEKIKEILKNTGKIPHLNNDELQLIRKITNNELDLVLRKKSR